MIFAQSVAHVPCASKAVDLIRTEHLMWDMLPRLMANKWGADPAEGVQGFQPHTLAQVPVQLPRSRQLGQAKQHFGSVGLLFGGEEDDGAAPLEASGADCQQQGLLHCLVLVL